MLQNQSKELQSIYSSDGELSKKEILLEHTQVVCNFTLEAIVEIKKRVVILFMLRKEGVHQKFKTFDKLQFCLCNQLLVSFCPKPFPGSIS